MAEDGAGCHNALSTKRDFEACRGYSAGARIIARFKPNGKYLACLEEPSLSKEPSKWSRT